MLFPPYHRFGEYLLLGEIAHGGAGHVYQAVHERLQRPCALKLIRTGAQASPVERARFLAESEAAASLDHPNIVPVRNAGEVEGQLFLEMELISGGTLADRLAAGPLPPRDAAALVARIAVAVQHSHDRGVLHRDLKPGNVLLSDDGTPRLTDFGLARLLDREGDLTQTVSVLGTPAYLAPEIAAGHARQATVAADVYGLGVILYEALTGHAPYAGDTPLAILQAVQDGPPLPPARVAPGLPRDLEILVLRATQREPEARLPSGGELARELERWLAGQPIRSRPVSAWEEVRGWVRRRPAWAALSMACGLLLLGLVASLALGRLRVGQALQLAQRNQAAAEAEGDLNRRRFVRLLADRAARSGRESAYARALPDLATAWVNDPAASSRDFVHRLRFGTTLSLAAKPRWVATLGHPPDRLAWSPDGRRLASASREGTTALWDAADGRLLGAPLQLGGAARTLIFTPDGSGLLVAGGSGGGSGQIRLLDGVSGAARAIAEFGADVQILAVHPGGGLGAAATRDGRVCFFELPSLAPTGRVLSHRQRIVSLAFAPSGEALVTASWDGTAVLWDWRTGRPLFPALSHPEWPRFATFSPDGTRVATVADDGLVRLWGSASGVLEHSLEGHQGRATRVSFSPDSRWLASVGHDRSARVWRADTGAALTPPLLHANDVVRATFHPTAPLLLTAGRDREVRFWELPSGRAVGTPLVHAAEVLDAQFNPAGTEVASASADGTLRLWPFDPARFRPADQLLGADGTALAVNRAGTLLAAGDGAGALYVGPAGTPALRLLVPGRPEGELVNWLGFSADGRWLGAAWRDGEVRVWELPEWRPVPVRGRHRGPAEVGLFTVDGRALLTGGADGRIVRHALDGPAETRESHGFADRVVALAASPDGRWLAVGTEALRSPVNSNGGWLYLVDTVTDQERLPARRTASPVRALAFDPGGERLAWDSGEGKVQISNPTTNGFPTLIELPHAGEVLTVAWSPDGRQLLTGSADGTARLWDVASGTLVIPALIHAGPVRAAWAAGGRLILTTSRDHSAVLWDALTGELVGGPLWHDGAVVAGAWLEPSRAVVTLGADRRLCRWPFTLFAGSPSEAGRWARALAGEEVDVLGGRIPLAPAELAAAWRAAYPDRVTYLGSP